MEKINKEIIMLIAPIALIAFIFIILNGNNEEFSDKDSYCLIFIIIITFVIMGIVSMIVIRFDIVENVLFRP
jgi:hypothetical protein